MTKAEEITKAIAAHGMWKARLANAIADSSSEIDVKNLQVDHACDFGRWLYGPSLGPVEKATAEYKAVQTLHASFHQTAARVLAAAQAGRKDEAHKMLEFGSDYAKVSGQLTQAMMAWKAKEV